jgi:hypothetical protein
MDEYIKREDAINSVFEAFADGKSAYDALNAIPAADVRPVVRGEWRKIGKTGCIFVCSACDKTFPCKTHYCPNCGADMRRES